MNNMKGNASPPTFKAEIERLSNEEDNLFCFDCQSQPADWASVDNGIFLCRNCSVDHKGYGFGNSCVRSIVTDEWNGMQLKIMKMGGNRQLRVFLNSNDIPSDIDKKTVYLSNIMTYYRKMLKATVTDAQFKEALPRKEDRFKVNLIETHYLLKAEAYHINQHRGFDRDGGELHLIEDNHYLKKQGMTEDEYDYEQSSGYYPMDNSKFTSISSYPNEANDTSSYYYYASSFIGSIWSKSKYVAGIVREKINNYALGRKITFVGDKAIQIIIYTGGVVIEKGSQLLNSETVTTIAAKANDSFAFVKSKIAKSSSSYVSNDSSSAYIDVGDSKERLFSYEHI